MLSKREDDGAGSRGARSRGARNGPTGRLPGPGSGSGGELLRQGLGVVASEEPALQATERGKLGAEPGILLPIDLGISTR